MCTIFSHTKYISNYVKKCNGILTDMKRNSTLPLYHMKRFPKGHQLEQKQAP